jgi:hypothetical protein
LSILNMDLSDTTSQTDLLNKVSASIQALSPNIPAGSLALGFAALPEAIVASGGADFCMCPSLNEKPSGCPFSCAPTEIPTRHPTALPTALPTTDAPTPTPTADPTKGPTKAPTAIPTDAPSDAPTDVPTAEPTMSPTSLCQCYTNVDPTAWTLRGLQYENAGAGLMGCTYIATTVPTAAPTNMPTDAPTKAPTKAPTAKPTTLQERVGSLISIEYAVGSDACTRKASR